MAVRVAPRPRPAAAPAAPARARLAARAPTVICVVALTIFAAVELSTLTRKSPTIDEYVQLPAGVAYLYGDFRPNAEHPPLAKALAALPLVALGVAPPPVAPAESPTKQRDDAAKYFWAANADRFDAIAFWARVPMIALAVALGALLFAFARALAGPRAAALAVVLYALEPTVLAHARVVHTDLPSALGLLGAVAAAWWHTRAPSARRAALLGLALGLAAVTKFSLLTLAPLAAALLAVLWLRAPACGLARRAVAAQAALAGAVALFAVHAAYAFRRQPLDAAERAWVARQAGDRAAATLDWLDRLAWPLPPRFVFGAYQQLLHTAEGHPAGLLGDYQLHGWWYYFPVAYALKTPLPLLAVVVAALAWAIWRVAARRERRLLWALVPLAAFVGVALTSRINIGIRHLLPAYPFLLILAGAALDRLWSAAPARPLGRLAVVGLVGWLALVTARAYPDYTPYLNEIARRAPAWALLSDSNVEWGDDLGALAADLRARGETGIVGALLGGRDFLPLYGLAYTDAVEVNVRERAASGRYIAIGASALNGSTVPLLDGNFRPDYFAPYRYRTPEAVYGGSIFLFRNDPPPPNPTAPLPADAFRATVGVRGVPATLRPGQSILIAVTITNASPVPWPPGGDPRDPRFQVRLANRWRAAQGSAVRDDARAPLPTALAPGATIRLTLPITAPPDPGDYLLDLDLVQEGVAWFADRGSAPLRLPVRVVR